MIKKMTTYSKSLLCLLAFIFLTTEYTSAQVGINSDNRNPDASAMLDISSPDKGILIPRMDSTNRKNINAPAQGLMVFDSTTLSFWYYADNWTEVAGAFVSENSITYSTNNDNDFVFGADSLNHGSGMETKFFFNRNKGAFRAGGIDNTEWDGSSIGNYSTAFGYNNAVSEDYSFAAGEGHIISETHSAAFGYEHEISNDGSFATGEYNEITSRFSSAFGGENEITGDYSFSAGNHNTVSGKYATAIGLHLETVSYGEVAIGVYNTAYTANETKAFDSADRLFIIGNGTGNNNRSDALIVYKNGHTEINGDLKVNGSITELNSVFTSENDITHSNNNNDDFVYGADSLNHGSGEETKFFFNKNKGAFRVGRIQNTNWEDTNLGIYSFATGTNTIASGNNSAAFGYQTIASEVHTFAGGNQSQATGNISFAYGREVIAPSFGEFAIGLYNTTYSPNDATGFDATDRLFVIGNGTDDINRSDAMVIYKNGNAAINGNLTINDNGGTEFMRLDSGRLEILNTGNSIFIGEGAGANDDFSNNKNTFLGTNSGYANATGGGNTFIGNSSGFTNTKGNNNTFIGNSSGYNNTEGNNNICIGFQSAESNTTGSFNVAIGVLSAESNTTGELNVFLGQETGYRNDEGNNNVFLGALSGRSNITGSRNVFIGSTAGYSETGSDKLYIDNSGTNSPLIYGEFNNRRIVINGNNSDNSNSRTLFVNGSIGAISAFNNDSDRRLKKGIQTIPNALDKVLQMRGVTYQWKDGRETGDRMGFIAQEVEPILPEVVDNGNDHYTMQYAPITAVLIEGMKEQQVVIEELKMEHKKLKISHSELKAEVAKIQQLEQQNAEMKAMLEQIQAQLGN